MKKRLALLCGCALLLCSLTACFGKKNEQQTPATTDQKIGLGSVQSVTVADDAHAVVKATVAAVKLDKDGKILDCKLDEVSFTVEIKEGMPQMVADLISKWEQGDMYIPTADETGGVESPHSWAQQVEKFCDFTVGKTHAQITGLATTDGKSDQIEGCDLVVTDFIQAVDHAMKGAKNAWVQPDDDLHLAVTAMADDAASQNRPKYTIEMAAVTVGEGDKITGCMTDTLQAELNATEGVFAAVTGTMQTKRQMKDAYGMKAASAIKREWYEQADAFDTFAVGHTADSLAGTKLDGEGKTDAISGCTVSVSAMLKNVVKAAKQK